MKYSLIVLLGLCSLLVAVTFLSNPTLETRASASPTSWQEAVEYAREHLPQEGKLMAKSDGFVYLKVDDNYVYTLFPMLGLAKEGFREPPYFRRRESPGAHISIFYVDEHVRPDEIGQTFHFTPEQIRIVKPSKFTSYAVLQVHSPELEKLREKYGLSPKLHGKEFHISIAKKAQ